MSETIVVGGKPVSIEEDTCGEWVIYGEAGTLHLDRFGRWEVGQISADDVHPTEAAAREFARKHADQPGEVKPPKWFREGIELEEMPWIGQCPPDDRELPTEAFDGVFYGVYPEEGFACECNGIFRVQADADAYAETLGCDCFVLPTHVAATMWNSFDEPSGNWHPAPASELEQLQAAAEAVIEQHKTALRASHHVTCNHRNQAIGGPGCVCEVVNKHNLAEIVDAALAAKGAAADGQ